MRSFERLYGLTSAKLLGICTRILRDRQAAEDVVQDVYVKVWRSAGTYSSEAGRPMTWLIAIARNRAIDVLRRRREAALPETADGVSLLDSIVDPYDGEAAFLTSDSLATCLEVLDEPQRRCFLLAYLDGYSREELAAHFERPVNTIKTWLHRSALTLRLCMERA